MPGLRENIRDILSREPRIDTEFSSLIPPLTPEEYSGLEQSIISEGCRDAIILWNNIIIDGHNRYKICTEHHIPFRTETKDFESREDVILWMFRNQLSRRNLNDFQRIEVVRKYEHTVRAQAKERQGTRNDLHTCEQNFPEVNSIANEKLSATRATDELGAMANVSRKTYEHAIAIIDKAPEVVTNAVRKNELSINAGYKVTKMHPEQQAEIAQRIENGENPANVVSDVRKRIAAKTKQHKDLTVHLTIEEYEHIKALARARKIDINSLMLLLIREAIGANNE